MIMIENNRKSCCESTFIPNKITTIKNINVLGGCQRSTYVRMYLRMNQDDEQVYDV